MGGMPTPSSHIIVLKRPLHKSFKIFLDTLGWWWEMGQEFVYGKTCGGGINLCILNSKSIQNCHS